MAFDLHIVRSETRKLTVKYADQSLEVEYRPALITTEFAADMKMAEVEQDVEGMANGADKMLASWDMVDNGEPVEASLEVLRQLPLDLLGAIFAAVMEDVTATEETKKD